MRKSGIARGGQSPPAREPGWKDRSVGAAARRNPNPGSRIPPGSGSRLADSDDLPTWSSRRVVKSTSRRAATVTRKADEDSWKRQEVVKGRMSPVTADLKSQIATSNQCRAQSGIGHRGPPVKPKTRLPNSVVVALRLASEIRTEVENIILFEHKGETLDNYSHHSLQKKYLS